MVAIVGRHVTLRHTTGRHWGLCPFHSEKTPSFSVQPDKQIFYCFGCGEGGDLFTFRMRAEGLDFPEAVRVTAQEVGIELAEARGGEEGRATQLAGANETALSFFRRALGSPDGAIARTYLERRGIPADLVERFEIGYAPGSWEGLVRYLGSEQVSTKLAERAGLIARRQTGNGWYDRLRSRVVFPIRDAAGRLLGFGGRALDPDAPKYLNTPETPLYRKSRVLFGLPNALDSLRQRERAILVEGYFDVLALHRAGLPEGLAPCGTALTPDHARRLGRYVREVVLLFDSDEAGERAARRALPLLLAEGLRVRAGALPPGDDPDSIVGRAGAGALRSVVESAGPFLDRLLEETVKGYDGHAWSAADAVRSIAPYVLALPDPVERQAYVRTLATHLEVPLKAVVEGMERHRGPRTPESEDASSARPEVTLDSVSRALVGAVLQATELSSSVTESDIQSLPSREAQELLGEMLEAARLHGERALAHLLSPVSRLGPALKAALSQIAVESGPLTLGAAEQTLRDCRVRLGTQALDRESREINQRLSKCTDPEEERALLEAKQEMLKKRRHLLN